MYSKYTIYYVKPRFTITTGTAKRSNFLFHDLIGTNPPYFGCWRIAYLTDQCMVIIDSSRIDVDRINNLNNLVTIKHNNK